VVAHGAGLQSVHDLVGFFHEIRQKRAQRLFAIPRASVGRQQSLHEADQAGKPGASFLARHGIKIQRWCRCFVAHGGAV